MLRVKSGFLFVSLIVLVNCAVAEDQVWNEAPKHFLPVYNQIQIDPPQYDSLPGFGVFRALEQRTWLRRVTDNYSGYRHGLHRYSRRQAWNASENMLDIGNRIVDANTLEVRSGFIDLSTARVWSYTNPDIMFGIRYVNGIANVLSSYNVLSGKHTTLAVLDSYKACSFGNGEGNMSVDERYVLISCYRNGSNAVHLLSFNLHNQKIVGRYEVQANYSWASFTQSGKNIVLELKDAGGSGHSELIRFSPWFTDKTLIATQRHHGDLGVDSHGDDVFVMIDWDYISYVRIKDGARVNLNITTPGVNNAGHGHISCRNNLRPGWCYFSSYGQGIIGAIKIAPSTETSKSYDNEGLLGYTANSEVEIWAHHRSHSQRYGSQPKVSASPSGKQLIFSSDWYGEVVAEDFVVTLPLQ